MKLQLWSENNGEPDELLAELDVTQEQLDLAQANVIAAQQIIEQITVDL